MAVNAKMRTFAWRMQVSAANGSVGEIYIYDDIMSHESWWDDGGVTPQKFKEDLDALGDVSLINVYINSDGGDVFAGQAILSQLTRHPATVHAYIDGLAASIASCIPMGADKIIMPSNSMMMVHNPWTMIWDWIAGNADYFREMAEQMAKVADNLDHIRESMIAAYMRRFKGTREELIALLDKESWLTAQECFELGFCDEIEGAKLIAASLSGAVLSVNGRDFDLSRFRNRPQMPHRGSEGSGPPAPAAEIPPATTEVQGAGRVPSAENEDLIRAAHDSLGKVLDKLGAADATPDNPQDAIRDPVIAPVLDPPDGSSDEHKARVKAQLETLRSQIETKRRR